MLPENIHELANGRLHVSVTDIYTLKNILIDHYSDKKEVIDVIISSSYIPGFSGIMPPLVRHGRCIDGGFSVNQVILEDDAHATLTVSPFSGDTHICPRVRGSGLVRFNVAQQWADLSWDNMAKLQDVLFPQGPEESSNLLLQGYHDAVDFLARYGQIMSTCGTCLTVKATFSPKDVLKVSFSKV